MLNAQALYAELKPQIGAVANELFTLSEAFLRDQGNFLPHGAVLTSDGAIRLVAADPGNGDSEARSTEVMPLLHYGLREQATSEVAAVAVAENVTVTLEGQPSTSAIKVLFEHRDGLAVALYLPFDVQPGGTYAFGTVFSKVAEPEVGAWQNGVA